MKKLFSAAVIISLGAAFAAAELPAPKFDLAGLTAGNIKSMEINGAAVPAVPKASDPAVLSADGPLEAAVNRMIDAEMEAYSDLNEAAPIIAKGYYQDGSEGLVKKHTDAVMAEALAYLKKAGAELDNASALLARPGSCDAKDIYVAGGMLDISVLYLSGCERQVERMKKSGRRLPEIINVIDAELKRIRGKYEAIKPLLR